MRRLIISDLHLGSLFVNEDELIKLLSEEKYDELILAGDIIDFLRIPKFTKKTLEIFNLIFVNSKSIIYLVGNHDLAFINFVDNDILDKIKFKKKYEFTDNDKKVRIEHGNDYDLRSIIKWEYLISLLCVIINIIERLTNFNLLKYYENYFCKKKDKININNIMKINNDVDIFIMGHVHEPKIINTNFNIKNHMQIYANSGDWVNNNSYLILENGNIELKFINN